MDTFRNLFGNATATILRLALVAGTIILISVFIVKPALETTEEISGNITRSTQGISNSIQQQIQQSVPNTVPQQRLPTQIQITRTIRGLNAQQAQRFSQCLQRAGGSQRSTAASGASAVGRGGRRCGGAGAASRCRRAERQRRRRVVRAAVRRFAEPFWGL